MISEKKPTCELHTLRKTLQCAYINVLSNVELRKESFGQTQQKTNLITTTTKPLSNALFLFDEENYISS